MADRNAPIGVFDSGIGGLTVAREIIRQIPDEPIVYFGDTARLPYGSKSKDTIIRFSRQVLHFLESQRVKAIVIACNTASAYALDTLQRETDLPVIGPIFFSHNILEFCGLRAYVKSKFIGYNPKIS